MFGKFFGKIFGVKDEGKKGETIGVKNETVERKVTNVATEEQVADFQKITAKMIAEENGIGYIPKATGARIQLDKEFVTKVLAAEGKYILLHPANDGMPTCPIEWYGKFNGEYQMIMDNQTSFKYITNLSEIILQMVRMYAKYIDENVFIGAMGFAIRLDDEVCPYYYGKASLVLTDDAIQNRYVKPEIAVEAKKFCVNEFLDHFIGWNFGVAVRSNPELEKELLKLNDLVISKGLRKDVGPGLRVWSSIDVEHYELKKTV